jgi:hypothetical protein
MTYSVAILTRCGRILHRYRTRSTGMEAHQGEQPARPAYVKIMFQDASEITVASRSMTHLPDHDTHPSQESMRAMVDESERLAAVLRNADTKGCC